MAKTSAEDRILIAKTRLMMDHPFFGVLACHLELIDATADPRIDTMATDGKRLYWHGPFVLSLNLKELQFVLAHEVMHNALDHHTRQGGRDHRRFNEACDYAINGELVACNVGKMPECGLIDDRYTGLGAEEIYRLLEKEEQSGGRASGAGNDPGGCGQVLQAAAPHDEAGLDEARRETQIRVRQAAAVCKGANAGVLPAGVQRIIDQIVRAKVDWRAVLRRFIDQCLTRDYSWAKPNKRLLPQGLYFPSLIPDGISHLVVAIDTSGSIDDEILAAFAAEVNAAAGEGVDKLTVIYADAEVKRVDVFEMGEPFIPAPEGGGGTNFRDTFRWISEHAPDASAVIYLTDMITSSFGEEPKPPVLWAAWGDSKTVEMMSQQTTFGETIHIEP